MCRCLGYAGQRLQMVSTPNPDTAFQTQCFDHSGSSRELTSQKKSAFGQGSRQFQH